MKNAHSQSGKSELALKGELAVGRGGLQLKHVRPRA